MCHIISLTPRLIEVLMKQKLKLLTVSIYLPKEDGFNSLLFLGGQLEQLTFLLFLKKVFTARTTTPSESMKRKTSTTIRM